MRFRGYARGMRLAWALILLLLPLLLLPSCARGDGGSRTVKADGPGDDLLAESDVAHVVIAQPTPDGERIVDIRKRIRLREQSVFGAWKETVGLSGDFQVLDYEETRNDTDVVASHDGSMAYGRRFGDVTIELDISSGFRDCLQPEREEAMVASLVRTLLMNSGGPYPEKSKVYITVEGDPFVTALHDFSGPLTLEQYETYWIGNLVDTGPHLLMARGAPLAA